VEDIFRTYVALGGPDRQGEAATIVLSRSPLSSTYSLRDTEYYTSREEINIVLELSEKPDIPSTTYDVSHICPR
jgi:hypothetical protein